jgi:DNA-binding NarL/FixJ family response regulator
MASPQAVVRLVAPAGADTADVVDPLAKAGFATQQQDRPPPAVIVVLVDSAPEGAAALTRRLRADTAASPLPVLWLVSADTLSAAPAGLDAGADACLVRPVDGELLVAQVNALLRTHRHLTRFAAKGADARDLTDRLQKLFRQSEADATLARGTARAFAPREPLGVGAVRAAWSHRPAARGGMGVFDVAAGGDGLRFAVADVGGLGPTGGAVAAQAVVRALLRDVEGATPADALGTANQRLLELNLPDAAVVAAAAGTAHAESGRVTVACGGLPAPVRVPVAGPAGVWHGSGPFLGVSGAAFFDITGDLAPGEKLVLVAGGAGADRRPDVRALAEAHRHLAVRPFADAVATDLLADAHPDDGFTLLAVERA